MNWKRLELSVKRIIEKYSTKQGVKMKYKTIKLISIITIALAQLTMGQITYETKVTSKGFMGMGAFKSTTKTYLINNAQRTDTKLKFTGKFLKYMSPKGTAVSVVRLDKKLVWDWISNGSKKTYHERTFKEIKELMEEGAEYQSQSMPESDEDYEADYKWKKPNVKVVKLKDKKTINEFDCQHYLATVTTIGTHIETGIKDTMIFESDLWNAKNVSSKMNQVFEFNKKYMKAVGFDVPQNQGLAMIGGMYKDQMQMLEKETNKLKGYPIVNNMKLTMTNNLASEEKETDEEEPKEESLSMRDIQRNFKGLVGKKIMKDALDKKAKEKADEPKKSSVSTMFQMKSEVLSINDGDISGDKFEVKKGYKLKKN